jgi:hypothetical protein
MNLIFSLLKILIVLGLSVFLFFIVEGVLILLWTTLASYFVERPRENAFEKRFPIGEEAIFRGRYHAHGAGWAFILRSERGIWDKKHWWCQLVWPREGGWDKKTDELARELRNDLQKYEVEFRGKLIEKGRFGDRRMLRYKIVVLEILSLHLDDASSGSLLRSSDKPVPSAEELLRSAKQSVQIDPHTLLRPNNSEDVR